MKALVIILTLLSLWLATEPPIRWFIVRKMLRWPKEEDLQPIIPQMNLIQTSYHDPIRYGAELTLSPYYADRKEVAYDQLRESIFRKWMDDKMVFWDEEETYEGTIMKAEIMVINPKPRS